MKTITFDAQLIETGDLVHVTKHILEHAPCIAFYKIIYPMGNAGHFLGVTEGGHVLSTSIGEEMYNKILRIRL